MEKTAVSAADRLAGGAGQPGRSQPPADLAGQAVGFARWLRGKNIGVTMQNCVTYLDALATLSRSRSGDAAELSANDLYWAGRLTLLGKPAELERYDAAFAEFWGGELASLAFTAMGEEAIALAFDDGEDETGDQAPAADPEQSDSQVRQISIRYSPQEVLRDKDFAELSESELEQVNQLIAQLPTAGPTIASRRLRPSTKPAHALDIRQTVKSALRTEGDVLKWHHQQRRVRQRNLVFLLDVSGSMSLYAQALLRFAHATVCARQKVEVFAIGTRLTRLTRELSVRNPGEALSSATTSVQDWLGGTRLGDTLATFNNRWGVPGLARGSVVVILSDGWDRGEPEQISQQMLRLHRVAYQIIWVNPLKATPDYAPLAQGMAAALPHVDCFVEGHSLNALAELAELIARHAELAERSVQPAMPQSVMLQRAVA